MFDRVLNTPLGGCTIFLSEKTAIHQEIGPGEIGL